MRVCVFVCFLSNDVQGLQPTSCGLIIASCMTVCTVRQHKDSSACDDCRGTSSVSFLKDHTMTKGHGRVYKCDAVYMGI